MNISDSAKERLKSINWFGNVGVEYNSAFYRVVNASGFISSIKSDEWENATLEARNEITGFLARKHTVIYQEWNKLAKEASGFIDDSIIPFIPKIDGVDMDVILVNLKWDLVSYLVEDAYKDKLRSALFLMNWFLFMKEGISLAVGMAYGRTVISLFIDVKGILKIAMALIFYQMIKIISAINNGMPGRWLSSDFWEEMPNLFKS